MLQWVCVSLVSAASEALAYETSSLFDKKGDEVQVHVERETLLRGDANERVEDPGEVTGSRGFGDTMEAADNPACSQPC